MMADKWRCKLHSRCRQPKHQIDLFGFAEDYRFFDYCEDIGFMPIRIDMTLSALKFAIGTARMNHRVKIRNILPGIKLVNVLDRH